jgi:hypothetical protein
MDVRKYIQLLTWGARTAHRATAREAPIKRRRRNTSLDQQRKSGTGKLQHHILVDLNQNSVVMRVIRNSV